MSIYKPKGKPYYYFDFVLRGVRFHGSTGTASKEAARAIERRERDRAALGAPRARDPLPLNQAAERYFQEVGQHQRSKATIDYQLENLVRGLGKATLLSAIDEPALAAYVGRRRAQVTRRKTLPAPASINRELELLRRLFTRARRVWKTETPEEIDWGALRLEEPAERVRELTADEETRLLAKLRPDYHPIVMVAFRTGLRLENLVALEWSQIDIAAMAMRFQGKSRKPGGKTFSVPLTPDLLKVIRERCPKTHARVFTFVAEKSWREPKRKAVYKKGERYPVTRAGLRRAFTAALAAAEIQNFRWHDLRHTAATRTLRRSGNLKAVQRLLAHEDIGTTAKYAHALLDDVRAAMMAAEPGESRHSPDANPEADANALKKKA